MIGYAESVDRSITVRKPLHLNACIHNIYIKFPDRACEASDHGDQSAKGQYQLGLRCDGWSVAKKQIQQVA